MSNRRKAKMPPTPLTLPPEPDWWDLPRAQQLERIMDSNRKGLMACTADVDCKSSIHVPGCLAVR